jgi:hypothetical protein
MQQVQQHVITIKTLQAHQVQAVAVHHQQQQSITTSTTIHNHHLTMAAVEAVAVLAVHHLQVDKNFLLTFCIFEKLCTLLM